MNLPQYDSERPLRWGILATGKIAGVFARGLACSETGKLVAVASRNLENAQAFAGAHDAARAHGSYDALLADPEVEAVYIATPHPLHAEWTQKAVFAGKHVLCEKPAGMNRAEVQMMIEAARTAGVLFMEAFMYRCHPQTRRIVQMVRDGVLGHVGMVQATFSFETPFDENSRLWSKALGGGGILDVGGYPVSFSRLIAGAMDGAPFAEPGRIEAVGNLDSRTGVDALTAAVLAFSNGMLAQISCGVGLMQQNAARIYGSEGWLEIPTPWICPREGGDSIFWLHRKNRELPEKIVITAGNLYAYEADAFAEALNHGAHEVSAMSHADSLGNMAILDTWRDKLTGLD